MLNIIYAQKYKINMVITMQILRKGGKCEETGRLAREKQGASCLFIIFFKKKEKEIKVVKIL